MMPAMSNVRPVFAIPEECFQDPFANENIHYDVDENLWPNPQNRVDENIKCSEGHSS